jgi:hypothetical protein
MPKGFFFQTICLLLARPVPLDELQPLLVDFEVLKRTEAAQSPEIAGPGLSISYRPEVNGLVVVDLQNGHAICGRHFLSSLFHSAARRK